MIQAFGKRVLVRLVEKEKKKGCLLLPEEKREHQIGRVVSIGADLYLYEASTEGFIAEGDYVYTRKYAGLLLEYDDVEYVSLDSTEILAVSKELK